MQQTSLTSSRLARFAILAGLGLFLTACQHTAGDGIVSGSGLVLATQGDCVVRNVPIYDVDNDRTYVVERRYCGGAEQPAE
jgi:hypothetical protein